MPIIKSWIFTRLEPNFLTLKKETSMWMKSKCLPRILAVLNHLANSTFVMTGLLQVNRWKASWRWASSSMDPLLIDSMSTSNNYLRSNSTGCDVPSNLAMNLRLCCFVFCALSLLKVGSFANVLKMRFPLFLKRHAIVLRQISEHELNSL